MDEWFEPDWLDAAAGWVAGAIADASGWKRKSPRRIKWIRRHIKSSGTEDEAKVRAAKRKTGKR